MTMSNQLASIGCSLALCTAVAGAVLLVAMVIVAVMI